MSSEDVYLNLVEYSGFNDYAASNDLIILYPQADGSIQTNPYTCWNTNEEFFPGDGNSTARWGNTGF